MSSMGTAGSPASETAGVTGSGGSSSGRGFFGGIGSDSVSEPESISPRDREI